MEKAKKSLTRYFIPPLILIIGIVIMASLSASRQKPQREEQSTPGVVVQVQIVEFESRQVTVRGHGTVKPRQEISLSSQVPGKIEWVDPRFIAGGRFKKGDPLCRIEQTDYILGVEQAQARVAGAEFGAMAARAKTENAREEWDQMQTANQKLPGNNKQNPEPDALVLREPQLKQAEAELQSAHAALAIAELRLERTIITAPFDCRIRQESIDVGQYVNPGVSVARLFSTDMVEIEVGIPLSEVMWLDIPGAEAEIHLHVDGKNFIWEGNVNRTVGVIGERERLSYVVVQVKDPLELHDENSIELSIGAFVEVEIKGRMLEKVISLPRQAIRDESHVWVVDEEGLLNVRDVTVERLVPGEALISSGLVSGEKVILSSIIGGAEGMKVRVTVNGEIESPEIEGDSQ